MICFQKACMELYINHLSYVNAEKQYKEQLEFLCAEIVPYFEKLFEKEFGKIICDIQVTNHKGNAVELILFGFCFDIDGGEYYIYITEDDKLSVEHYCDDELSKICDEYKGITFDKIMDFIDEFAENTGVEASINKCNKL